MLRTLLTAFCASCILGLLLGLGIARSFLLTNCWEPGLEVQSYAKLVQTASVQVVRSGARAHIEETTYNFGFMNVKANGSHDFFIQNMGTEDLILALDKTTCSCTDIKITPTRVPPGETATCHLMYSAEQAMTGTFAQGGVIRTSDPDYREINLMVKGVFADPIVMLPPAVNLPSVPFGTTRTATIRFYGFEAEPLQLSAPAWIDREHIDFQWNTVEFPKMDESNYLSAAKWGIEGIITVKPGLPGGPFWDRFQVKTNYSSMPSIIFTVSGQISGKVSISGQWYNRTTGIANLGQTIAGKRLSREISIQFSGPSARSASVQITTVEPGWLRTTLSPTLESERLSIFSLIVEIPENAPLVSYVFGGDGQQAHITLETNDESMPVLRIPLQFVVGGQ